MQGLIVEVCPGLSSRQNHLIADFKETSAPKTISMSETSVTVNESLAQLTKLVESWVPQADHGKHLGQRFTTHKIVMSQIETLHKKCPASEDPCLCMVTT